MRRRTIILATMALAVSGAAAVVAPVDAGAAGPGLSSAGSVTLSTLGGASGADGLQSPETAKGEGAEGEHAAGPGKAVRSTPVRAAGAELAVTFAGLNHRDNRLANRGNQFSSEPPDQALCVGPNHILEGVNTVFRTFTKSGTPTSNVISYNEFFGYPPAINRTTGVFGAFLTDPVCHFDSDTGRFYMVVLTLDQDADTGNFTGKNRLDIAVSKTADPNGAWFRYKLAVQNDGTEGTPNHRCAPDPDVTEGRTNPAACIGDYPHIGFDKFGAWVTTNEYSFFGEDAAAGSLYNGSQIYGISKRSLANGTPGQLVYFEGPKLGPFDSFTVIPAISPAGKATGTEFFLSSTLGDGSETGNKAPSENRIGVWAATNTRSFDSSAPNVKLVNRLVKADSYALPPKATQKAGPIPLGECFADTAGAFGGDNCGAALFGVDPTGDVEGELDSSDTRMGQVVAADGMLTGALGTAVSVGGQTRAGVLWMQVKAEAEDRKLDAEVKRTGYVAIAGNDVIYPAAGLSSSGKAVLAVTVSGDDHYPSAGYVTLGRDGDRSTVTIASEGKGPQDGFTEYPIFGGGRPRWGDYGATAMDGDTLWIASESIEQSCTLTQYLTPPIGSCGATRTSLANWGTRVSGLRLSGRGDD